MTSRLNNTIATRLAPYEGEADAVQPDTYGQVSDMSSIDLGRLDLVSTTSGLQLQLSSLAQFAASVEGSAHKALTLQALDADFRERPWIHRASNFRVVLGLRLAETLQGAVQGNVVENLTNSLREAKACSQGLPWRAQCTDSIS